METFVIAPAMHQTARKTVHDYCFPVYNDIILVFMHQHFCFYRGTEAGIEFAAVFFGINTGHSHHRFGKNKPFVSNRYLVVLLVNLVMDIFFHSPGNSSKTGILFTRFRACAGENQRSPRLIYQDRINFVYNTIIKPALDFIFFSQHCVVFQIIKPELVIRSISNRTAIHMPTHISRHSLENNTCRKTKIVIYPPDILCVTLCQIIIGRNNMDTFSRKRVKIRRERRNERLALTCSHLGNFAFMKSYTANKLNIIMTPAGYPFRRLTDQCERAGKNII